VTTTAATTTLAPPGGRYKWVALSNTTLGVLMSALDGSIVIIDIVLRELQAAMDVEEVRLLGPVTPG
jgi:hypothetical protein